MDGFGVTLLTEGISERVRSIPLGLSGQVPGVPWTRTLGCVVVLGDL